MEPDDEKIMTLHPEGKQGVNISRSKYNMIKNSMVSVLKENGEVRWKDLKDIVEEDLKGRFEGSIPWYFTSIKLDLQARNEITITRVKGNQIVRLTEIDGK